MEDDFNLLGKRKRKPKVIEDFVSLEQIKGKVRPKKIEKTKQKTTFQKSFECELCSTPNFVKGTSEKKKSRHIYDIQKNKVLRVCNACGLKFKRKGKQKRESNNHRRKIIPEDKISYINEAKSFALEIASLVNDKDAENFFCPKFKSKPCKCLQKFIQLEKGNIEETKKRVNLLLRYHRRSAELISENDRTATRSEEYDNFVLTNRDYLKTQLSLCEQAVQKVLRYSNNYLYKVTAIGEGKRVEIQPTIGQEKLNLAVTEVCDLHSKECSNSLCVEDVAGLHIDVIQEWRDRALESQKSRRIVIQEMMLRRTLCRQFIQMVTGAGLSCILRLSKLCDK